MLDHVDKELVPIKSHYFLFNAATGPVIQFLPTIARQMGFTGFMVGSIYTVLPISGLIAKPLFGGLADKYRLHKTFFLIFQALLAIAFFLINFLPNVQVTAPVVLTCDGGVAFVEVCTPHGFSQNVSNSVITRNATHSNCHLTCNVTSNTYGELCSGWKANEYCSLVSENVTPSTTFDFTAEFSMHENLQMANCMGIRVRNVTFPNEDDVHKPICSSKLRTSCLAYCYDSTALKNMLLEVENVQNPSLTSTYQFHSFLWAAIVSWVGMAVVVSIADAICFDLLGDERRKEYGKQRMWGSIGFGIFGISAGYLVDVFSRGSIEKDYTCIYYLMLIGMIFDMIVSATLKKKSVDRSENEPSVLWELSAVAREGRVLVFGFWCIGAGICTGVVWNFLFWYIDELVPKEQVEWSKTLQGLMTGVQCFLGELPFNFLSGRVLKKLGHINVMSLVLLTYAVRFMAYSLVTNAWTILIVELLHGPTMGLCWPTMVSYGDKVAPSGTRATMQGFVGAVFEGIGVACGSLVCGRLMDSYGGVMTFRVFSAGALVWLSVYWVLQLLLRKAKSYPIHQGHSHLASYANPSDAILMTASQELQTY